MRAFRLLLIGVVLLWAQLALDVHAIEHAFHEHDEACVECLSLPGMQAVPVFTVQRLPVVAARQPKIFAVLPAPTFSKSFYFRSRAPPFAQSR